MTIINEELLDMVKLGFPHLYDIQTKINEVINHTGFGDVTVNLTIRNKQVEIIDIGQFNKTVYRK